MRRVVLLFCALSALSSVALADLRSEMSDAEFSATGLDKLTKSELQALDRWLQRRAVEAEKVVDLPSSQGNPPIARTITETPKPPAPPAVSKPVRQSEKRFGEEQIAKPVEDDIPEQISARIKGEIRGWDGETIFRLDNGQVWQQRVGGKYRGPKRTNPEVIIERGRFGYYLRLVDGKRKVGVRRLR